MGEPFLDQSQFSNQGQRVVEGQRLMQGASDIFLGWDQFEGEDGITRDFYLRQLWDWKLSAAHRPDAPRDHGYLRRDVRLGAGPGPRPLRRSPSPSAPTWATAIASTESMWRFAAAYADQNERDYARLPTAIASGQVTAISDV